jgi:hypothetical protein
LGRVRLEHHRLLVDLFLVLKPQIEAGLGAALSTKALGETLRVALSQPGLIFVRPLTGFQVLSAHSISGVIPQL